MAFTPYHNIAGATSLNNELVGVRDLFKYKINSIQLTNIHSSASATVDLYLFKDSTDTETLKVYYLLRKVIIPQGTALLLEQSDILRFDNTSEGYSLYITVGSSDTVDVLIGIGPKK